MSIDIITLILATKMPFISQAQRRYMYAKHPGIAKEFESKTPKGAILPEHVAKKKTTKIPRVVRKHKSQIQKYKNRFSTSKHNNNRV